MTPHEDEAWSERERVAASAGTPAWAGVLDRVLKSSRWDGDGESPLDSLSVPQEERRPILTMRVRDGSWTAGELSRMLRLYPNEPVVLRGNELRIYLKENQ